MKEYAKRKIIENTGEITADAYDTTASLFVTKKGDIKDIDLYNEKDNLEYVKQLENDYVERKFTKAEKQRIKAASRGEKDEVKSQIREERLIEFKKVMLTQAQKSKSGQEVNPDGGNLDVFATKLMLSLNYLSTQELFKRANLTNKLQNTAGMLGDIIRFGEKTLETDETLFNASLYTITTMFGYVKKNLDELKTDVRAAIAQASIDVKTEKDEKVKEALNSDIMLKDEVTKTIDDLAEGAGSLGNYIVRLESRGLDAYKKVSEKDGNVLWRDVFQSTFTKELIEQKKVMDSGAGTSVEQKLENDQVTEFKRNETVENEVEFVSKVFYSRRYSRIGETFKANKELASEILRYFARGWYYYEASQKSISEKTKKANEQEAQINISLLFEKLESIDYISDAGEIKELFNKYGKSAYTLIDAKDKAQLSEGDNLALRNQATEHLAFLFGADKLIVKSKDVTLKTEVIKTQNGVATDDGNPYQEVTLKPGVNITEGSIKEEVKGETIEDIRKKYYSPLYKEYEKDQTGIKPSFVVSKNAMDQIMTLRFMDAVAGQINRQDSDIIGEFTVDEEKRQVIITSIKGTNNEMAFGDNEDLFGLLEDVSDTYKFDYCPRALFEAVKTITPELLRESMANYVEPAHMEAMIRRFTRLKNALIENKEIIDLTGEDLLEGKTDIFDNVEDYTGFTSSPFVLDRREKKKQ